MQVITQRTTNIGDRYKFYFGEPVLLTIVLPDHVSKFDPKNDMAIYLGDPPALLYHLDTICEVLFRATPTPPSKAQSGHHGYSSGLYNNVYNREKQLRDFSQDTILRQVPPDAS
jgi:hypothetical protein